MPIRLQTLAVLLLLAIPAAQAQTAYVIDKLLVGVHAERDLDSAIVKVLPTGAKLEIVQRDGELALIRDSEGIEGWIDAAYLMDEPPARGRVETLEKANAELKARLAAGGGAGAPTDRAEVDALTKENTELKRKLSAEILAVTELRETVAELNTRLQDRPLSAAETQVTELKKELTETTKELEQTMQANRDLEARVKAAAGSPVPEVTIEGFSWPVFAGIAVLLALAFGGGIYAMDYLNRRRHGGFRV